MGGVDEMFESILRPSNTYNTRNKPVIHFSRWGASLWEIGVWVSKTERKRTAAK